MTRRRAILSLWATCLIWGSAFPLAKLALRDATPMTFTALRFLLATVLIAPSLRRATREEWRAGALLGSLLALGFGTQTIGLQWTTASRSGFITALYIPFVPLIVLLVYRTLPERLAAIGLAIALGGLTLLTHPSGFTGGVNTGDLLTLLCAVFFASHMVVTGAFSRRFEIGKLMMTQIATAAILTTLATPLLERPRASPTPLLITMVIFEAVLASVVAIRLQLAAQRVLSPTYAALVYTLEPVVASATSFLILGDRLTALQWLGGVLIIAGSLLPEIRRGLFSRS